MTKKNNIREDYLVNGIKITRKNGKYYINNSEPIPEKAVQGIITILQNLIENKYE